MQPSSITGHSGVLVRLHNIAYGLLLSCAAFLMCLPLLAQDLIINGLGPYVEFGEPAMLVRLETQVPAEDALEAIALEGTKRLSFRILQDRTARAWSRVWIQNLSINNSPDTISTQTSDLIAMTQSIQGTLRAGDLLVFERVANELTTLSVNGKDIAAFETPGFFEFLLSAFVGAIPPSGELKSALLSGGNPVPKLVVRFDELTYSSERSRQVAVWALPAPGAVTIPEATDVKVEDPTAEGIAASSAGSGELSSEEGLAAQRGSAESGQVSTDTAASDTLAGDEDLPVAITAESLLAVQDYQRAVLQKVYRLIEFPASAVRRNREGSLRIQLYIAEDGGLLDVQITQESAYQILDQAALRAARDAAPFDVLPESTLEIPMVLEIPVSFRLQ